MYVTLVACGFVEQFQLLRTDEDVCDSNFNSPYERKSGVK